MACGLLNGGLVTALRIPPFIVTLGMLGIARGLAKLLAGNQRIAPPPESVGWLEGFVDKTPEPAWLLMAPAVCGTFDEPPSFLAVFLLLFIEDWVFFGLFIEKRHTC